MNTLNGYSKSTLTDNYVLTAAGGHLAVGNAANNIPLNNSTVNTNLNADLLDGTHKSGLFTALANISNSDHPESIYATIGGTTKYLKVNYSLASRKLFSSSAKNLGGLSYYYTSGTSSTDNTGNWAGPTSNTTYMSILRLQSHTTAGALYYRDLIFDVNSDKIWSRRVTNSGTPSLTQLAMATDVKPSGYVTSATASLSSYWGKLWEVTRTEISDDLDITFYIHSAYNSERGFVHLKARRHSSTTDGVTTYSFNCWIKQIAGNLIKSRFRLYYNASSGKLLLWCNVNERWGVYNCTIVSSTTRVGKESFPYIGTLYSTSFTTALTLPTDSYVELTNIYEPYHVTVSQHTSNNIEYPIVWSNSTSTSTTTGNLLYKSYADLIYNPANKRITVKGYVETPKINNASGSLTLNGKTNIYLKINDTDSLAINFAGTYFKPYGSAKNLIDLGISDARWKGVYANTGDFSSTVSASAFYGALGDASMTIKPEKNNEVNFGGTNNSAIIYFGYRATDSKPIPTTFVFGGNAGSSTLKATALYGSGRLTLNAGATALDLKYNNDNTKSVILNGSEFKPFDDANGKLDLGASDARWKVIYGGTGNFVGNVESITTTGDPVKHAVTNANGSVELLIHSNRGLYDRTNAKWIIYVPNGTSNVRVPTWASIGNSTTPVYFNANGEPTACTSYTSALDGRYVKKAGDAMTGKLFMSTTITDHSKPTEQCLVINSNAIPEGTTLTLKNAPGIGFHIPNYNWGSLVFKGDFNFINSDATSFLPVKASKFVTNGGTSSLFVKGDGSLDSNTYLTSHLSLANYVTLNSALTISGVKTFSSLQKFTVALGTSPFTVTSTTVVTNLNADLLDGIHANGLLTALSSNATNKVSLTVGGTTKNITTLYASYLCSVGVANPQKGRTLAYGNVYSYNTSANYYEGAPSTYTSVIGFGIGTAGTVEICGEWTAGRGLWVRALRDYLDDWYAWDRILTAATYSQVLDNRYYTESESDSRFVNVTGDTMTGNLTVPQVNGNLNGDITKSNPLLCASSELNNINIVNNENHAITTNSPTSLASIKKAISFRWYNDYWLIGNIRGSGLGTIGFGITYNNDNLCFRVTTSGTYSYYNMYAPHFYENSDINLKTNIKPISDSDNIPQLKEFDWKEDGSHSYGLIALELEEQGYSELVSIKDDGYKTVNYSAALSLIVGKLQVKIKELEKEIEILKKKN